MGGQHSVSRCHKIRLSPGFGDKGMRRAAHWLLGRPQHYGRQGLDDKRAERIATEKRYLKRKWKSHIRIETYKSQDRVAMDAPRRQSVKL